MAKFFLFDKKGIEWYHVLIIGALAIMLYIMFLQPSGIPEGPDLKGVVKDGACTSRTGAEVVICCLKANSETGELESVPCDEAKVETQALVTTGGATYNIDGVCFAIKASNNGNVDLDFDVTNANTVASNGGDVAGAGEIDNSWADIVNAGTILDVPPGTFQEFSMDCVNNPIKLSAGGFTMTNGRYTTTIDVSATSPSGSVASASKVLELDIEQENLGFSIDVGMI